MQKMLFVLTALALPLTAHAEEVQLAPKTIPEATIQASVKEFADPWCKTGFKGLVANVQNCFKQTPESSPNIDKCIVGHYTLLNQTAVAQKLSQKTGQEDPTVNIPFIKPYVMHDRGVHYTNLPRYNNVNMVEYFSPAIDQVIAHINNNRSQCPSN